MKPAPLSRYVAGLICASSLISTLLILKLFTSTSHPQVYAGSTLKQKSDGFLKDSKLKVLMHRTGIDFKSLLRTSLEPPICLRGQTLMILVTSAPWHLEQRNAIRSTWGKKDGGNAYSWQVLFLIGHRSELGIPQEFVQEQRAYGDILMGNYADCYRNLTLKVMHGFKWAVDNCEPQFILKTDDDCFVNTDRLPRFLAEHNNFKNNLYAGSLFAQGKRDVIRDPLSKWYVSKEDYREDEYPPYASGIGYVLSEDVVQQILKIAEFIPPVPMEDAYVGILAKEAGISVKSSGRFTKHNVSWRVCNYRYLMVIHHLDTIELQLAQQNMIKARTACSETQEITRWKEVK
nr:PREDICTED: beta-1,3-galactosyltransferase 5-like isoform X1 [Lepisosteus oculatus]XP_015194403.1 PREDICTED: beta-1,3-galactosyltransferase 5-like isoform X1 [Lepisosteus oculatus]